MEGFQEVLDREGGETGVRVKQDGEKLVIEADLASDPGLSSSGKSFLLVNTHGLQRVDIPYGGGVSLSLTVTQSVKQAKTGRRRIKAAA